MDDYWRIQRCEEHPGTLKEKIKEDREMLLWYSDDADRQKKHGYPVNAVTAARIKFYEERLAEFEKLYQLQLELRVASESHSHQGKGSCETLANK